LQNPVGCLPSPEFEVCPSREMIPKCSLGMRALGIGS